MPIRTPLKKLLLSVYADDMKVAGKKQTLIWCEKSHERRWFGITDIFLLIICIWDVFNDNVKWAKILLTITEPCLNHEISAGGTEKLPWSENIRISSWSYNMEGHAKKCVHFQRGRKLKGELSKLSSQIVLKCFFLARIGRPDIPWSGKKFARSITKWAKACDKRLNRLISYIHHTCEFQQYCYVGSATKQCRLGLFQDSDFAGDLEDSKSTSGGTLCIFGSHTFVPINWMCEKQTSVSHSSTESEIISLDAGLRLDGITALDLWDLIVAVLHGNTHQSSQARGGLCTNQREVLVQYFAHFKNKKKISWNDWWFEQW